MKRCWWSFHWVRVDNYSSKSMYICQIFLSSALAGRLYPWLKECNCRWWHWQHEHVFQTPKDLSWTMASFLSYYHMNVHDILHIYQCLDFPLFEFSTSEDFFILKLCLVDTVSSCKYLKNNIMINTSSKRFHYLWV